MARQLPPKPPTMKSRLKDWPPPDPAAACGAACNEELLTAATTCSFCGAPVASELLTVRCCCCWRAAPADEPEAPPPLLPTPAPPARPAALALQSRLRAAHVGHSTGALALDALRRA